MTSSYDFSRDRGWDSQHCVQKEIRRKHRKLLLPLRESGLSRHLISMVTGNPGETCPKVAVHHTFFYRSTSPQVLQAQTRTYGLHNFSHAEACKEDNTIYKGVRGRIVVSSNPPQSAKMPTSSPPPLKCSTATIVSCHNYYF